MPTLAIYGGGGVGGRGGANGEVLRSSIRSRVI